jgi:predicted Rossmann fold flavoprotein
VIESDLLKKKIAIIGGGAAGFFCAAILAETINPSSITIFERADNVLQKVKISGGGRCNVTHACSDPKELIKSYPRGTKEMLGPFHNFDIQSTINWFEKNGVILKTEADGRMFPISDSSQTIIDCLWKATVLKGVVLKTRCAVNAFEEKEDQWLLNTDKGEYLADVLIIASGSSQNFWNIILKCTKHSLIQPVPSLFTFNCKADLLQNLQGVSVQQAEVKIIDSKFSAIGPILVTHWGLSGPAILKLSAWGARWLNEKSYTFNIEINWKPGWNKHHAFEWLLTMKKQHPKKKLATLNPELPTRLWHSLILNSVGNEERMLADLPHSVLEKVANSFVSTIINIDGKSTYKDEFVTAGGIGLHEIDFKTFQSKLHSHLYFAGEVLNIDAVTGGYNFQAAWTGAYIAAQGIVSSNTPK